MQVSTFKKKNNKSVKSKISAICIVDDYGHHLFLDQIILV
tara:strand:+ start:1333 stop:1452 length:120 start_codon:yes stop_codon:yes gene_type:complete